jgi:hypothetical protein
MTDTDRMDFDGISDVLIQSYDGEFIDIVLLRGPRDVAEQPQVRIRLHAYYKTIKMKVKK